MLKDLREWKTGEVRENVSNNEAVYLELDGYAEILGDETVTKPVEEAPVKRVRRVKVRKLSREMKPRLTKKGYETKEV
jgi:hypothetical protein